MTFGWDANLGREYVPRMGESKRPFRCGEYTWPGNAAGLSFHSTELGSRSLPYREDHSRVGFELLPERYRGSGGTQCTSLTPQIVTTPLPSPKPVLGVRWGKHGNWSIPALRRPCSKSFRASQKVGGRKIT
jgi:hypothetical protein